MKNTPLRKPRPAHPSKNPYKRRSWETDEDYNELYNFIKDKIDLSYNDYIAIHHQPHVDS